MSSTIRRARTKGHGRYETRAAQLAIARPGERGGGMMHYRTGGAQLIVPGLEVWQAGGGDTPWWLAAGITPVCAYAPKGAVGLASSYVNLANPGVFDAAPGVAPTFNTATGWTFNGTTQYLTTGVVTASNTYSVIVRFSALTNNGYVFGGRGGTLREIGIRPNLVSNVRYLYNNAVDAAPGLTAGVLAMTPTKGYRDGVEEATMSGWVGTSTADIWIGVRNNVGVASIFAAVTVQAFWIANSALDATQVATMTTAMQAL